MFTEKTQETDFLNVINKFYLKQSIVSAIVHTSIEPSINIY